MGQGFFVLSSTKRLQTNCLYVTIHFYVPVFSILLLYHCALCLWNVNYTTSAGSLSYSLG